MITALKAENSGQSPNVSACKCAALQEKSFVNSMLNKWNSLSSKEQDDLYKKAVLLGSFYTGKATAKEHKEILNIMMIINEAFNKSMDTNSLDQLCQSKWVDASNSFLELAQKALRENFSKESDITGSKASGGSWQFWLILGVIIAGVILAPELMELMPEAEAGAAAADGGAASLAETGAGAGATDGAAATVSNTATTAADDAAASSEVGTTTEAGTQTTNAATQTTENQAAAAARQEQNLSKLEKEKGFFGRMGSQAAKKGGKFWWKRAGSALMRGGMAGGAGFMIGPRIPGVEKYAPRSAGQPDQGKLVQAQTKDQIITGITNKMNNDIQTSTKRMSDDSQGIQQDAGYIQQAINELGQAMQIRV